MTDKHTTDKPLIITLTWVLLALYNAIYWPAKFFRDSEGGFLQDFYSSLGAHWYLVLFLEFLAIISLFVDTILRFDKMGKSWRKIQLLITSLLTVGFMTRLITGMMDLFLSGGLK